jgi:hypothetical protein
LLVGGISLGSTLAQAGDTFESLLARAEQGLAKPGDARKGASAGTGGSGLSPQD